MIISLFCSQIRSLPSNSNNSSNMKITFEEKFISHQSQTTGLDFFCLHVHNSFCFYSQYFLGGDLGHNGQIFVLQQDGQTFFVFVQFSHPVPYSFTGHSGRLLKMVNHRNGFQQAKDF